MANSPLNFRDKVTDSQGRVPGLIPDKNKGSLELEGVVVQNLTR